MRPRTASHPVCYPQALKLCALVPSPSMQGARQFEFNLLPRSATTLFHASFPGRIHTLSMAPRKFYHPRPPKLCALELQTFPLLPSISSAMLPPSSSHAVRSQAPCCYLHHPSPPSAILLPSSSQAVHPRNPSHPNCHPYSSTEAVHIAAC
jgi:hypothetical protein